MKVGDKVLNFMVLVNDLLEVMFDSIKGFVCLISVVFFIDIGVCDV